MSTLMPSRDGAAPIIRREDYAAPEYTIREAALSFDLAPAETLVASRLVIARDPARPRAPLRLHAEELRVDEVRVDGAPVAFRHEAGAVVLDAPAADVFVVEVRNAIAPEKNTQLSGLYASGSGLFTQCEAEGFRRITCFLDRPDVMARFSQGPGGGLANTLGSAGDDSGLGREWIIHDLKIRVQSSRCLCRSAVVMPRQSTSRSFN
jgi:aminopeptidase N